MASSLTLNYVDFSRLCLVRDAVEKLYCVNISADGENSLAGDKCDNAVNVAVDEKDDTGNKEGQLSSVRHTAPTSPYQMAQTVLQFEATSLPENIEKAKNFARTHLLPSDDYTSSLIKLKGQQEFKMVLESSQEIQTTTSALLMFNPSTLEVILQGPSSTVVSATSKVAAILGKLRETHPDQNIGLGGSISDELDQSYGQSYSMEKTNNNDCLNLSYLFLNTSDGQENAKFIPRKSRKNNDSFHSIMNQNGKNPAQISSHPGTHQNHPKFDDMDDIETDSGSSQSASILIESVLPACKTCSKAQKKSSSTSSFSSTSSESEVLWEETILTDARYTKKIEQALKLGYSERHVMEVLARLGPECTFNDLLSELIKLGTCDPELQPSHDTSMEANPVFLEDDMSSEQAQCDSVNLTTVSSTTQSIVADIRRSSLDGSCEGFPDADNSSNLRDIIIDGSNVAMSHGKKLFSCRGIQIAVDWFRERGHRNITAFVPQWRKETSRPDAPISDQEILSDLEKEGVVVFTPARRVKGRRVVCYDDRYILKLAVETDGIVVSNDVYRDLVNEREDFRQVVDQRLLMYSFVNDRFMPPEDPLGRLGPTLDNFLRRTPVDPTPRPQDCPYGKKCTYGNKCRFYHPERGFGPQKSVTETLKEQADLKLQERAAKMSEIAAEKVRRPRQKLARTKSLIPGEAQTLPVSPAAGSETKGDQRKPKFTHSKSLVCPSKTPDYLNESRRKLEEAELAAALEKMSSQDKPFLQKFPVEAYPPSDSDKRSKLKTPSPKPPSSPQKDDLRQNASVGSNQLKQSSPLKSVSPVAPSMSPSLLTVPKAESPEGYLSGHLYLAKKLSDESSENNFFSEYTSSPSSTRTSSPVVSSVKVLEHKQPDSNYRPNDMSKFLALTTQPYTSFQQQQVAYTPQIDQHLTSDSVPDINLFEDAAPSSPQKFGTFITSPAYGHHSMDDAQVADCVDPLSPDSGRFTLTEYISSPYQSHTQSDYPQQQLRSYPLSATEQTKSSRDQLGLWRAYSSIDNVRSAEEIHQRFGRRSSGFSASHLAPELATLKQHHQFGYPLDLTRQNSSSDPQIHNITGEHDDLLSSIFGTRNLQGSYFSLSQNSLDSQKHFQQLHQQQQLKSPQQGQFENQQYFTGMQHQLQQKQHPYQQHQYQHQQHQYQQQQLLYQQQQDALQLSPQLMSNPKMDAWRDSFHQNTYGHVISHGGVRQDQFGHQSTVPFHKANQSSYVQAGTSSAVTAGSHTSDLLQLQHLSQHQQPFKHHPAQYISASSTSMHPSSTGSGSRFIGQSTFPQHSNMLGGNIQPFQPAAAHVSVNEDALIHPDDPRYTIYYHLSSLFGEQIVRKVMNHHPNVLTPDQIFKLIIAYNKEKPN